jgi:hypothetical protein
MPEKPLSCVLLADRHHGLTEGVRGLRVREKGERQCSNVH